MATFEEHARRVLDTALDNFKIALGTARRIAIHLGHLSKCLIGKHEADPDSEQNEERPSGTVFADVLDTWIVGKCDHCGKKLERRL